MQVEWNKVTWYSKLLALALFVALPFAGFYFGIKYERLEGAVDRVPALSSSTAGVGAMVDWKQQVNGCIENAPSFLQPVTDRASMEQTRRTADAAERACITLPENIYPRDKRTLSGTNAAGLGYVSNWEESCGGSHVAPVGDNCTGDGFEPYGVGTAVFTAKSVVPGVPDITVTFVIASST